MLPYDRSHRRRRARVLRRQVRRQGARAEARRFLDRALRRHARASLGRHRLVQDRLRERHRGRRAAHRGRRRARARSTSSTRTKPCCARWPGSSRPAATTCRRKVAQLVERTRSLERELQALRQKLASGGGRDILKEAQVVNGIKVLAARLDGADAKSLRDTADQLKDKLGSGVVVLGAVEGDKVFLVASVTQDLAGRLKAGDLIKPVAELVRRPRRRPRRLRSGRRHPARQGRRGVGPRAGARSQPPDPPGVCLNPAPPQNWATLPSFSATMRPLRRLPRRDRRTGGTGQNDKNEAGLATECSRIALSHDACGRA